MYVNKILENTHKPVTHPHRSFVPCITIAINNNFYKKIKKCEANKSISAQKNCKLDDIIIKQTCL